MEYMKIKKEYELSLKNNVILTEHLPLVWSCSLVEIQYVKFVLKLNLVNSAPNVEQRTALTSLYVMSRFEQENQFHTVSPDITHNFTHSDYNKENVIGIAFKTGFLGLLKNTVTLKLMFTVQIPKERSPKPVSGYDLTNRNVANDQVLIAGSGWFAEGKEFHVNKAVLSAYSPFFDNLFNNENVVESKKDRIVLKDVDPKEFGLLLQIIYPTTAIINEDNVEYLWKLADRFGIECVVQMCEDFLCNIEAKDTGKASLENRMRIAELYNSEKLKKVIEMQIKEGGCVLL